MIRLLIVDDHPLIRAGLKVIVGDHEGISVAGEAGNAAQALDRIRGEAYDVVLMDIAMPGRSGLEALREIRAEHPELPVLILSLHPEEQYAIRALKAGASGYLTKDSAPQELVEAIQCVVRGKPYVTATLAQRLAAEMGAGGGRELHELLSDREYEVLCQLGRLRSVTEIAQEMSLSVKTVSTYRTRILEKLKLKQTADLVRYAREKRLVE